MYIQQIYTNCLAQAAYYIESEHEAMIIDPLRDPTPYIELADQRGAKIKYIAESHFHADFVSGHIDLAKATGATIVFGPDAAPHYAAHIAKDGEKLKLGKIAVEVLHTPGHTIESSCFLAYDEDFKPYALFSGDTLFAGDVGRPDLLSGNFDAVTLGGRLYDSLQSKIMPLADNIIVYPGHGAGSACGKNIGKETMTTIGEQKKTNYALQPMTKEKFVELVTTDQPVPPQYFFGDAAINKQGAGDFLKVINDALEFLSPFAFDALRAAGATVLDTRAPQEFAKAHIPGSINIGLDGDFAIWAGTLYPHGTAFLLVTDPGREKETITRLARIGYDSMNGILEGGIQAWIQDSRPVSSITSVTADGVEKLLATGEYELIDVRRPGEVATNRLRGANNLTLGMFPGALRNLDASKKYIVCCAGGYRSMIACSIMRSIDIENVTNLEGGVSQLIKAHSKLVETV